MTQKIKAFTKLFLPFAIGILLIAAWFLSSRNTVHKTLVLQRQELLVDLISTTLDRDLKTHTSDAQFLARLVAQHFDEKETIEHIEDAFSDFIRTHRLYFILRFLDETGTEQIRVDRSFAGPVVSPSSILQQKGNRYYVRDTMQAGEDDVYISDFDLNIEHGKIETPFRPTLRFGCPVIDANGRKRGIVIMNFEGDSLLNQIRMQAGNREGKPMLCTSDGYWILGLNSADEWGHLLNKTDGPSMSRQFPEAWQTITNQDQGHVITPKGLVTFASTQINPRSIISKTPVSQEAVNGGWKIMTWVPRQDLNVPWINLFIMLTILTFFLVGLGCWYHSQNKIIQAEVKANLRENEERTMAISQSSHDAIAMIDGVGTIIHWNPAAEKLFGYEAHEVMGSNLHTLLAPLKMRHIAEKGLEEFRRTGTGKLIGKVIQLEALAKGGITIPVELAVAAFDFKGKWHAVGTIRDMTQRLRDEQKLKRSEETSRALINAPADSAMLLKPNGTIVAINKVGAQELGGTPQNLIGKSAFNLLSPDFSETHKDKIIKVRESGSPLNFEESQGNRKLHINVYPVKAADGVVDRIALFTRDVTEQRLAEAALMQSEQRFRDVSEAVGEFIWETNKHGEFSFITDDVSLVLGYSSGELLGHMVQEFLPQEDLEDFKFWRRGLYEKPEQFSNIEARLITKQGGMIWLQASGTPYYDTAGEFSGFRGAAMNVTDRKEAEQAIKASERKLRALAESAYDAIIMIDNQGHISFWNDAAERLFGYTEREAIGRDVHDLIASPDEREKSKKGMRGFPLTGKGPAIGIVTEHMGLHKDGLQFPVERSISSFRLGESWYAVATIRDITEQKATEAKLRQLATTDGLTGLNNRRRFMELSEQELSHAIRYRRPLSIFMLDIDHFKRINDDYGHDVGDKVLRFMADISETALRNADILGRLGGEEFGVLLPETDENAAMDVAERLRHAIEENSIQEGEEVLNVTVSIGVSTLSSGLNTIKSLLKQADKALYEAKESGRNRVVKA
ncbi:sensor domain-containing diguanylate cyclase [Pseudodesulfovibrio piezophilus]|uniref:Diguanylate cyclase with PAS/PAC sensor n=1 Tax=Pseudodesulfovibrio piezophilus (strain DSM 21447 / JCM 15486 / C1TLV30) TaxID=1322246 RepID=M1WMI3_PSEP2|nr:PAS domain S-box protein [Pseudodesulfovibrio piezophilus]CCH49655.1 Diguanylate cyclase with PAS/PAC sensor [Pseudodesulfovibrio piezophilus C1TLV30]